jgi:hypothetical protein
LAGLRDLGVLNLVLLEVLAVAAILKGLEEVQLLTKDLTVEMAEDVAETIQQPLHLAVAVALAKLEMLMAKALAVTALHLL